MDFRSFLSSNLVRLDGGMGTLLLESGLPAGERPERWGLTHGDVITAIHRAYFEAGANVVATNTFGASLLHYSEEELAAIIKASVGYARRAAEEASAPGERFVALDVGPSGRLLAPLGDLCFEDAVSLFSATVRLGVEAGVDLILIETMSDAYETKAALLAAREVCDLPVIVTNAYGADGKLLTGATPAAMVALLEGLGADAVGANCSEGPRGLRGVALELLSAASVPVVLKPNAGLPRMTEGGTVYNVGPLEFAEEVAELVDLGVRVVGGCCGTTPAHIAALTEKTKGKSPLPIKEKEDTVISSYTHAVAFGRDPLLIGERINPTGKRRFREALAANDIGYLLSEAVKQEEAGVHILDVNVGVAGLSEEELLPEAVREIQAVSALPLCLDSANPTALEAAMRIYNGKPLVNSVNGKKESLDAVLPLVKKYGGVVIGLTLDEDGIPETAEGRLRVARRILEAAVGYGIQPRDVIFDPLTLTVATDPWAAKTTLAALRLIREELSAHTSLGVSNISFGLPARDALNATFFTLAMEAGLSAAIMNPYSAEMKRAYLSFRALLGLDGQLCDYIAAADSIAAPKDAPAVADTALADAIFHGLKKEAAAAAERLLLHTPPLLLVSSEIIPALNRVGLFYEEGRLYLPSLLMAAEAAGEAAERVKCALKREGTAAADKGPFVLATVKGDIHDIGKNIVKLILENYGYRVIDLGRDVSPERVLAAVIESHAPFCGLSALMTTTVGAMRETVALIKREAPYCRLIVGGAVLTEEAAAEMGADLYAPDPMTAVRFAGATENV